MTKRIALILTLTLMLSLLAGCMGTPVVICDHEDTTPTDAPAVTQPAEGAVKTGLAVIATAAESKSAGEEDGQAKFDITTVAVTLDDAGVITACRIDSVPGALNFNQEGALTSDLTAPILTKNELGYDYGMKAYAGAKYEWFQQIDALSQYAVGKTVEELKNGAIGEDGKAKDADLATTATIYLGGFVSAIEAAAANAQHLGAQAGDQLRLASVSGYSSSKSAEGEGSGLAQMDCTVTALTMNGDTITSAAIDAVQVKVEFDAAGTITTDLTAPVLTKNQLGDNYGMKAWGGATYEWYEQAASFAAYVTGKTAEEVSGIAVTEQGGAGDADLASSVTISIGGFKELILKAAAE